MLRHETDLVSYQIFIGETVYESQTFSKIRPVMLAHENGWQDASSAGFAEGEAVFSLDPVVLRKPPGHVVLFTVAPNDRVGRDRFVTTEVDEPYELFHALGNMGPEERRIAIVQTGVDRGLQEAPRILVPVGADQLAIPTMQRDGTGSRWVLSYQEPADRIPIYRRHPEGLSWIQINGRRFALPGRVAFEVVGHLNWQTDVDFLQSLLKLVRKSANFRTGGDDFNLSERTIEKICTFYRDNGIIGDGIGANEAMRGRIEAFVAKLRNGSDAANQVATALFEHPSIRDALTALSADALARIREQEAQRIRPEIIAGIEREMEDRLSRSQALQREIDDNERRVSERASELRRIDDLTEAGLTKLRAGVGTFVADFKEAGRTFAEIMEVAGSPNASVASSPAIQPNETNASPPWSLGRRETGEAISLTELPDVARKAAKAFGLAEADVRRIDILCRAGEVPVLVGASVERALDCYSSAISSGGIVRMPLDPGVLGPDDLWRAPLRGDATHLGRAWAAAESDPSTPRLVCLDDVDRASLSDWFTRFRILYRAHRPPNLFVVASCASGKLPDGFVDREIDLTVPVDGAIGALAASIVRPANARPKLHRLADPVSEPPDQDERDALLASLMEASLQGGDLGARLLGVFAAARTWFDAREAAAFVRGLARVATSGNPTRAPSGEPAQNSRTVGR